MIGKEDSSSSDGHQGDMPHKKNAWRTAQHSEGQQSECQSPAGSKNIDVAKK